MKTKLIALSILIGLSSLVDLQAQRKIEAPKKAKSLLAEAETNKNNFPVSEAKIRQAKAIDQGNSDISFNFGNLYIENNELDSARLRLIESIESTDDKSLKHKSYHNLGNIMMEEEQYQMAIDAYKDALRNNPTDEETRYNLAYARSKLDDENNDDNQDGDDNQDENQDQSEDEQDDNDDNEDGDGENEDQDDQNEDQDDKDGDEDENEDDQKDNEGDKDKDENEGDGGEDQQQPQQPENQEGKISPEQIQRLLEAIENQEKDIQEKMNADKAEGQKTKSGKDW